MTELLTAAQMRAIEQAAIASGEVTGLELMERAGRGVVDAILEWRPELALAPHRVVVLCGPGNNGGDGFVVARLLHQRGWDVETFLYGRDPDKIDDLSPDAARNARAWAALGPIRPFAEVAYPGRDALVIDALFGTGLTRPLPAEIAQKIGDKDLFTLSPRCVVAVDAPSGLCMDSGRVLGGGAPFWLDVGLTVTFHTPKVGHYLAAGPGFCGMVRVVDIGLDRGMGDAGSVSLLSPRIGPSTRWGNQPGPVAKRWGHKYGHGHALILSGGCGKGGAARLAARGALRIGAGLVTVGCPAAAVPENAARLDAIMLAEINGVDGLQTELRECKVKAVCIGPGFGLGPRLREYVEVVLAAKAATLPNATANAATVLDADALTEFEHDSQELFAMLHYGCVLTPHEGEYGRLFPDLLAKLKEPATKGPAYSKVDATREAAARAGCVILFKGADTVIADPDGRAAINSAHYDRAAPWLATAGSGDVLAGFITGLLTRGLAPMRAAETAAWLHVECARAFGPGLIAEDLPEQLPSVFRELGL